MGARGGGGGSLAEEGRERHRAETDAALAKEPASGDLLS
jgi:hypothetical protein